MFSTFIAILLILFVAIEVLSLIGFKTKYLWITMGDQTAKFQLMPRVCLVMGGNPLPFVAKNGNQITSGNDSEFVLYRNGFVMEWIDIRIRLSMGTNTELSKQILDTKATLKTRVKTS